VLVTTKPTTEAPDKKCPIKGNINSSGDKIYHVQGGRYYEATIIDVASGEQWFCSAKDAEKAGWRASRS
jgi:micrococcal nuclease